jgi:hypothetical protein
MSEGKNTGKWHGGKGSAIRKTSRADRYADNYDRIFGKKDAYESENPLERPYEPGVTSVYDDARLSTQTDEKAWGKNDKS